jgi:predicted transcriptional regulator
MQKEDIYLEVAESKVFILFFIRNLDMPIDDIRFNKIMLENRFMNYFFLRQYFGELVEEGMISVHSDNGRKIYDITEKGLSVLNMFESILPQGLKKRVKEIIKTMRKNIRNEMMITADYIPDEDNGYTALLKINEDTFPLIEIKIAAGSREDAKNICKNWTAFPQELYSEVLDTLVKDRKKHQ